MTVGTLISEVARTREARFEAFAHFTKPGGGAAFQRAHRAADAALLVALYEGAPTAEVSAAAGIPADELPKMLRRIASSGSKLAVDLLRQLYPITSAAA